MSTTTEHLKKVAQEAAGSGEVSVQAGARIGLPVTTIVEEGRRQGAEVIVVGSHGRTGLARAVLGSVAEKVVRDADRDVFLVHDGEPARAWPPRKIGVCVDVTFEEQDPMETLAVARAEELARTAETGAPAELHVVHALEPSWGPPMLVSDDLRGVMEKAHATDVKKRKERVEALARSAAEHGTPAEATVFDRDEHSSTGEAVAAWAETHDVDLLVVAAHRKKGVGRLLGSVAARIARVAPCPVFIVHPAPAVEGS